MQNSEYRILVTGGLGFIGSHTVVELVKEGYQVFIVDNLFNSSIVCLERLEKITGKKLPFEKIDVRDKEKMFAYFDKVRPHGVIHFASRKAVGESVEFPLLYYGENIQGTVTILEAMRKYECREFIFSSSATVYGDKRYAEETDPIKPFNPYGQTKAMIEQILKDEAKANGKLKVIALRYFNPVGAHESGLIGESPKDIPNNLMPIIQKVAVGIIPVLSVYGNDYDTPDGTGVRDYIHITDLAEGHVAALKRLKENEPGTWDAYNLGTGKGTSVLEMISAFDSASQTKLPYKVVGRRPGDVAELVAIPDKAKKELGWAAKFNIKDMCRDSWNWVKGNPQGYEEPEEKL